MLRSASDEIRAAIAHAEHLDDIRAIPFERFMHLALYGEHGFFTTGRGAGRRGDFITSPEVGPLFGAVLARALDAWWAELGHPDDFTVVDAGAGPGTLARSIRAASPACLGALNYVAVELSPTQRALHPEWVRSVDMMPTRPIANGVIIANELLDNLPFRLFVMDGRWLEAHVVARTRDAFEEVLRPAADIDTLGLPARAPHGARVPVQRSAARWIAESLRLLERGRLLAIDYASATTAGLAMRPWREWLRTYRFHERSGHYLRDPGTQDITTEVALDQLFANVGEPAAVRTQAQFLQHWGITELVEEGRREWTAAAARPTLEAMTMRSRVREADALLDPTGLGAFVAIEYATGTPP